MPREVSQVKGAEGWLSEFYYRKSHVIQSASGAGTGYHVRISVHYGYGADSGEDVYFNFSCQHDFDDIRFTDDDGTTELDYFRETSDTYNNVFWVEIPDDLSSSDQTIYVYYGNSSVSTTSNGTETFSEMFTHFPGTSLPSGWGNWYTEYGSTSVSDSLLKVTGDTGASGVWQTRAVKTDSTFSNDKSVMMRITSMVYSDRHGIDFGIANQPEYKTPADRMVYKSNWDGSWEGWVTEASDTGNSSQQDLDIPCVIQYARRTNLAHFYVDGELDWSNTQQVPTASLPIYFGVFRGANSAGSAERVYCDWVALRKWVCPEPAHGEWGSQESNPDNPPPPQSDWLDGWTYRKKVIINQTTNWLANWQINVTFHAGSGTDSGQHIYLGGKSQADFDDIRITATNNTLWDCWAETDEFYSGDNCTVWIEVRESIHEGDVEFYVYYGNSTVENVWNGTNTFIEWDDFDEGYEVGDPPSSARGWTVSYFSTGPPSDVCEIRNNPTGRPGQSLRFEEQGEAGTGLRLRKNYNLGAIGLQQHLAVEYWYRLDEQDFGAGTIGIYPYMYGSSSYLQQLRQGYIYVWDSDPIRQYTPSPPGLFLGLDTWKHLTIYLHGSDVDVYVDPPVPDGANPPVYWFDGGFDTVGSGVNVFYFWANAWNRETKMNIDEFFIRYCRWPDIGVNIVAIGAEETEEEASPEEPENTTPSIDSYSISDTDFPIGQIVSFWITTTDVDGATDITNVTLSVFDWSDAPYDSRDRFDFLWDGSFSESWDWKNWATLRIAECAKTAVDSDTITVKFVFTMEDAPSDPAWMDIQIDVKDVHGAGSGIGRDNYFRVYLPGGSPGTPSGPDGDGGYVLPGSTPPSLDPTTPLPPGYIPPGALPPSQGGQYFFPMSLKAFINPFQIPQGYTKKVKMMVEWSGVNTLKVTTVEFSGVNKQWADTEELPQIFTKSLTGQSGEGYLEVIVTVPHDADLGDYTIPATVNAESSAGTVSTGSWVNFEVVEPPRGKIFPLLPDWMTILFLLVIVAVVLYAYLQD